MMCSYSTFQLGRSTTDTRVSPSRRKGKCSETARITLAPSPPFTSNPTIEAQSIVQALAGAIPFSASGKLGTEFEKPGRLTF
jgi:hypothetical protein